MLSLKYVIIGSIINMLQEVNFLNKFKYFEKLIIDFRAKNILIHTKNLNKTLYLKKLHRRVSVV